MEDIELKKHYVLDWAKAVCGLSVSAKAAKLLERDGKLLSRLWDAAVASDNSAFESICEQANSLDYLRVNKEIAAIEFTSRSPLLERREVN